MTVSAIIPYHSGRTYLELCLASLAREAAFLEEILVISNHPTQPPPTDVTRFDKVRLLHTPEALGYARAINLGAAEAAHPYLLFCDADTFFPQQGWLARHLDLHRRRPEVGVTSSKLVDYNTGRILDCGIGRTRMNHFHHFLDVPHTHKPTRINRHVQMACSAVMVTTKSLFEYVGGHDQNLHNYYQDVDLCARINANGKEVWVVGEALAFHRLGSASVLRGAYKTDERGYYSAKNAERLQVDFPRYFAGQLQTHRDCFAANETYGLVDCSTINTLDEMLPALEEVAPLERLIEARPHARDMSELFLVELTPQFLHKHPNPLLFLVDRHISLRHNSVWSLARDTRRDIIVDRHGNIRRFDEVVAPWEDT